MLRIRSLTFDEQNLDHIAKHHVSQEEVEQACYSEALYRQARRGRLAVYGQTLGGRYLIAFLAPRGRGIYYVITARDMTRAERRRYQAWRKQ